VLLFRRNGQLDAARVNRFYGARGAYWPSCPVSTARVPSTRNKGCSDMKESQRTSSAFVRAYARLFLLKHDVKDDWWDRGGIAVQIKRHDSSARRIWMLCPLIGKLPLNQKKLARPVGYSSMFAQDKSFLAALQVTYKALSHPVQAASTSIALLQIVHIYSGTRQPAQYTGALQISTNPLRPSLVPQACGRSTVRLTPSPPRTPAPTAARLQRYGVVATHQSYDEYSFQ
jgi:hypothetical protein